MEPDPTLPPSVPPPPDPSRSSVPLSTLVAKQVKFTHMVMSLLVHIYSRLPGYTVTFGEAYRTPEQAAWNAAKGSGISQSLHTDRLAIDLILRINGILQTDSAAYLPLGEYWESIGGSWGGRFKAADGTPKPDGNHFSLEHAGRK